MAEQSNIMRGYAEQARADAAAATLDNVRERCLRAAAAWTAMAERSERTARARDAREAGKVQVSG